MRGTELVGVGGYSVNDILRIEFQEKNPIELENRVKELFGKKILTLAEFLTLDLPDRYKYCVALHLLPKNLLVDFLHEISWQFVSIKLHRSPTKKEKEQASKIVEEEFKSQPCSNMAWRIDETMRNIYYEITMRFRTHGDFVMENLRDKFWNEFVSHCNNLLILYAVIMEIGE